MLITFFCKLHNENYDLWLHKWRIAINLYPKHAWYIIYNLIFSRTIYLAPVARLVCQNVLGENTRRRYLYMHTQLFPVSKTDGFQKFEHARPKTISKNARPFSSHARTQFMLHYRSTATCIINAVKKGSFGLSCGNVLGVRICCCIHKRDNI